MANNDQTTTSTPWTICPACGVGPKGDHEKDCPRAGWNQTYRPKPKEDKK